MIDAGDVVRRVRGGIDEIGSGMQQESRLDLTGMKAVGSFLLAYAFK